MGSVRTPKLCIFSDCLGQQISDHLRNHFRKYRFNHSLRTVYCRPYCIAFASLNQRDPVSRIVPNEHAKDVCDHVNHGELGKSSAILKRLTNVKARN